MKKTRRGVAVMLSLAMIIGLMAGVLQPQVAEAGTISWGSIIEKRGVCIGNGMVEGIDNGDYIGFKAMNFSKLKKLSFQYYKGSTSQCWVKMYIRLDKTSGTIIGQYTFTDRQKEWTTKTLDLSKKNITGSHKVYFTFGCNHYQWRTGDATPYLKLKGFGYTANSSGTVTKPGKPTLQSITYIGSKYERPYKFKWSSVSGAKGYQVHVSKSSSFKPIYASGYMTGTYTYFGYADKCTYYVRVRAYKVSGNSRVYGPWSNVKSFRYSPGAVG